MKVHFYGELFNAGKFVLSMFFLVGACSPERTKVVQEGADSMSISPRNEVVAATSEEVATPSTPREDSTGSGADDFFDLCREAGTTIPLNVARTYLDETAAEGTGISFSTRGTDKVNGWVVVFYSVFKAVGPGVTEYHAATFSKGGRRQSDIILGEDIPYGGPMGTSGKETTYEVTNGSIRVINETVDWDEEKEQDVTRTTEYFYTVNEEGFLVEGVARSYAFASERLLEMDELENFSIDDLKWMRNEIYAVHGYAFKSREMKDHFNQMSWYQSLYDNVDHLLTDIEKENIQRILKAEKR